MPYFTAESSLDPAICADVDAAFPADLAEAAIDLVWAVASTGERAANSRQSSYSPRATDNDGVLYASAYCDRNFLDWRVQLSVTDDDGMEIQSFRVWFGPEITEQFTIEAW